MGTRGVSPKRRLRGWSMTPTSSRPDEKQKERIAAKNGLESYCFNMKSTMDDEKLKEKISEDENKTISSKCDEALKWLDSNQLAEVEEFQDKQKEVEAVCNPIISKLYQQGGAPGGGMP